jgi:hypothetical protein
MSNISYQLSALSPQPDFKHTTKPALPCGIGFSLCLTELGPCPATTILRALVTQASACAFLRPTSLISSFIPTPDSSLIWN